MSGSGPTRKPRPRPLDGRFWEHPSRGAAAGAGILLDPGPGYAQLGSISTIVLGKRMTRQAVATDRLK